MDIHESILIGGQKCRNRLVMPALATKLASEGRVSPELTAFYTRRCRAGIGLCITEHAYVCPQGMASPKQLSIADDSCIEGLKRLAGEIKDCGSLVFAQISHAGLKASSDYSGIQSVSSASAGKARMLSTGEIKELVCRFAEAAVRAERAGFDGVELHGAHGYLLNQFYSPLINTRRDEYGADCIENRLRLHTEIISSIRSAAGDKFPIALRLGGCDYTEGGSSLSDSVSAARLLEKAGAVLLDISGGMLGPMVPGRTEAYFKDMSSLIKKSASVPVMLTGGITRGAQAQALLDEGAADLIGIGRALIKNPLWAAEEL